jgi:hypothetical protein
MAQPIPMTRTQGVYGRKSYSARGEDRMSLNDMMTPSLDFGECRGGKFLTTDVALVIAVGESRRDFSQVIASDWLTTKCTERLRARRPAIHQDKFHPRLHLRSSFKTTAPGPTIFSR